MPARLAALLLTALLCGTAQGQALQIVGTDVPPLIYQHQGRVQGFCVDLVQALQQRLKDDAPIQLLPWPRVIAMAQASADVLLVCPKRTREREDRFLWVGPLHTSRTFFYVRADSPVRLRSLEQARTLSGVLLPRASYSYEWLQAQGFDNLKPIGGTGINPLRMLMAGREPALVLEDTQLQALLDEAELPAHSVRPAYLALVTDGYLAFSTATAATRVRAWQQQLDQMKRDGSYEALHQRWFGRKPGAELMRTGLPASGR